MSSCAWASEMCEFWPPSSSSFVLRSRITTSHIQTENRFNCYHGILFVSKGRLVEDERRWWRLWWRFIRGYRLRPYHTPEVWTQVSIFSHEAGQNNAESEFHTNRRVWGHFRFQSPPPRNRGHNNKKNRSKRNNCVQYYILSKRNTIAWEDLLLCWGCVFYICAAYAENIQLAIWVVIERNCILYCRRWVDNNKLRRKGRPELSWVPMALLLLLLVVVVN